MGDVRAGGQRCWNHKTRYVLDQIRKRGPVEGDELLEAVVYPPTRAAALRAREAFKKRLGSWYLRAVASPREDRERRASHRLRPTATKRFKGFVGPDCLMDWKFSVTSAVKR